MYANSNLTNTKFHMLCGENIDASIISECFKCIQQGKNSIFFLSDKMVVESLLKNGAELSDAVNYNIVGCYEAGSEGELSCTTNGRISIPKALEFALNNGKDIITGYQTGLFTNSDFETFDELFDEFERQIAHISKKSMEVIALFESHYNKLHCTPLFSSTYPDTLMKGKDLYCDYGAKYNNSSINANKLLFLHKSVYSVGFVRARKMTIAHFYVQQGHLFTSEQNMKHKPFHSFLQKTRHILTTVAVE